MRLFFNFCSTERYVSKKLEDLENRSKKSQEGITINPPKRNKPIGFQAIACAHSPWSKANMARVDPQEGQGIPEIFLITQTEPTYLDNKVLICM